VLLFKQKNLLSPFFLTFAIQTPLHFHFMRKAKATSRRDVASADRLQQNSVRPPSPIVTPNNDANDSDNENDDNENGGASVVVSSSSSSSSSSNNGRTLADMLADQHEMERNVKARNEAAALRGVKRSRLHDDHTNDTLDHDHNDGDGDDDATVDPVDAINEDNEDDDDNDEGGASSTITVTTNGRGGNSNSRNNGSSVNDNNNNGTVQPKRKRKKSDAPLEMSSKVPVSRHRQVIANKGHRGRDPRFDDMCGDYKEDLFKSACIHISSLSLPLSLSLIMAVGNVTHHCID
jgi:hypothetical protein